MAEPEPPYWESGGGAPGIWGGAPTAGDENFLNLYMGNTTGNLSKIYEKTLSLTVERALKISTAHSHIHKRPENCKKDDETIVFD